MNRLLDLESQLVARSQRKPKRGNGTAARKKEQPASVDAMPSGGAKPTVSAKAKSLARASAMGVPQRRAIAFAVSLPWTGTISHMRAHLAHNRGRTEFTTTSSTVNIDFTSAWSGPLPRASLYTMPALVKISIYKWGFTSNDFVAAATFPAGSSTVHTAKYSGLEPGGTYMLDFQFEPFQAIPSTFPYLSGQARVYV